MSYDLEALLAAGGNSRAARSARARLQWRDRYGRWVEMGRGVKFKVRLSNGSTVSASGKFVGATDEGKMGQVYVSKDPNGLPDGFYKVSSANGQEILASLDQNVLSQQGIELGKDAKGNTISERADKDIPNVADIPFSDSPEGWVRQESGVGGQTKWATEDGEFVMTHRTGFSQKTKKMEDFWGLNHPATDGANRYKQYHDVGKVFAEINRMDDLSNGNEERSAEAARLQAEMPGPDAPLKDRLKIYDPEGKVAQLIDSGAQGGQIIAELQKNQNWLNGENDINNPADLPSKLDKERTAAFKALRDEVMALTGGQAPDQQGNQVQDVAKEGFLIPTGKKATDASPASIASLVESERSYLSESKGTRLVVDTDANTAELYASADTLENAKAKAGGMGAPEIMDLATGETIQNDKTAYNENSGTEKGGADPNPDQNPDAAQEKTNGQEDRTDSKQPEPNDTGSGEPVGDTGSRNAGDNGSSDGGDKQDSANDAGDQPEERRVAGQRKRDPNAEPEADSLEKLQERLDKLNAQFEKTTNGVALDRIEKQIADLEDKMANWVEDIQKSVEPPKPEKSAASTSEAPADKKPEPDLTQQAADLKARVRGENTPATKPEPKQEAGLSEEQIAKIIEDTTANGGGSFDLNNGGAQPTDGYMVATRGNNREIPADQFGPDDVRKYQADFAAELAKPGMHLGTWLDTDNNEIVLDVSERVSDRDTAIQLGKERNQQAIWDNANFEEIDTEGTGDRQPLETVNADVNVEAEKRVWKSRQAYPGLAQNPDAPVELEDGEFFNSAAVQDLGNPDEIPDDSVPPTDFLPSDNQADSIDGDEDTWDSQRKLASLPQGVTPNSRNPVEPVEEVDLGWEDKDEDYADMKFMPTPEQRQIVKGVLGGRDVAVQALAGTGKTSTLELIAKRISEEFPDKQILYIAFNKSVQVEAESRMPKNVESRTGDSLGYQGVPNDISRKMFNREALIRADEIAAHLGLRDLNVDGETIEADDYARSLANVLNAFAISEDSGINARHFEGQDIPFNPETLAAAEKYWADLISPNGQIKVNNSHITKLWALGNPDLSKAGSGVKKKADIIFFDEAQDINPVMAKVVRDQGIQKVYVGDGRQAIYSFRGAENELDKVETDVTLPLTQSWRFGPEVAGMGNRFLSLLDSEYKVVGGGPSSEVVPDGSMTDADAILTRSNAGAVSAILQELDNERVVGVAKKTKDDLSSLIQTVYWLKLGGRKPRMHEDLAGYKSWEEVERDIDRGKASTKTEMLVGLVNKTGLQQIKRAVDSLRVTDAEDAGPMASGNIDLKPGAKGSLDKGAKFEVTAAAEGLRIDVFNSFKIKDQLKARGFRFDGDKKSWYKTGTADSLATDLGLEGAAPGEQLAPIDVVVTTAHKAKGLEWDNVKIGDDFRGPREIELEDGSTVMQYPSKEEVRLAYVAVTRAKKKLDAGSLGWVRDYTDDSDEDPKNPSRGSGWWEDSTEPDPVPENPVNTFEEAPTPAPEPDAPPTPEVAPEPNEVEAAPEPEPTPEVAPEPEAVPEVTPTAQETQDALDEQQFPTPDVQPAPGGVQPGEPQEAPVGPNETVTPLDEGDGLPDSIDELEDMAGRLERQIDGEPRESRRRVLQREVDRIYDKIDSLAEPAPVSEPAPEAAPVDTPPPVANTLRERLDNILEAETPEVPEESAEAAPEGEDETPGPVKNILETELQGREVPEERIADFQSILDNPDSTSGDIQRAIREVSDFPNKPNTVTTPRPSATPESDRDNELIALENDPANILDPNLIIKAVKQAHPGYTTKPNGDLIIQTKTVGQKRFDLGVRRTNREEFFAYVQMTDLKTGESKAVRMRNGGKNNQSFKALRTQIGSGQQVLQTNSEAWFKRKKKGVESLAPGEELGNGPLGGYIEGTHLPQTKNEVYNRVVESIARMVEDPDVARSVLNKLATENGFNPDLVDQVASAVARKKLIDSQSNLNQEGPTHVSYDGTIIEEGQWVDWTDTDRTIPVLGPDGKALRDAAGNVINEPNPNYGRVFRGYVQKMIPRAQNNKGYGYTDNVWAIFRDYNLERGSKPSRQRLRTSAGLKVVNQNDPISAPFFPEGRLEKVAQASDFDVPTTGNKTKPRPQMNANLDWQPFETVLSDDNLAAHWDNTGVNLPDTKIAMTKRLSESDSVTGPRTGIQPGDIMVDMKGPNMDAELVVSADHGPNHSTLTMVKNDKDGYVARTRVVSGNAAFTWFRPQPMDTSFDGAVRETKGLLATKSAPAEMRKNFESALNSPDLTRDQLTDIRETINALKDRQKSKNTAPVKNVLEGVREDAASDPAVAEAPGVSDITDALRAIDQDNSRLTGVEPDPFGGEAVRPLDRGTLNGFEHFDQFAYQDLETGDVVDVVGWADTKSLPVRLQILGIEDSGEPGLLPPTFRVRVSMGPGVADTTPIRLGRGQGTINGTGSHKEEIHHGDIATWTPDEFNMYGGAAEPRGPVNRPTDQVADYFAEPGRARKAHPNRSAFVLKTGAGDEKEVARHDRAISNLQKAYRKGFTPSNQSFNEGNSNVEAAIGYTTDGRHVFTKTVESIDALDHEVAAMLVANNIGIESNHTSRLPDEEYRIVMDGIDGHSGSTDEGYAKTQAIMEDFANNKQAQLLGLLDIITVNQDRNPGNYMYLPGSNDPIPVDNEFAIFQVGTDWDSEFADKLASLIRSGNSPLSSAELLRIKNQLGLLQGHFSAMGMGAEWEAMMINLERVINGVNGYVF